MRRAGRRVALGVGWLQVGLGRGHVTLAAIETIEDLRQPPLQGLVFQNLSEHLQGNHFLRPSEIEAAMRRVGLKPTTHLFAGGKEMVVVGRR